MGMKTIIKKTKKNIPEFLIYEMKNGIPIYYKNYQLVLNKKIPPEAIMGSSKIQSIIIRIIVNFLLKNLNLQQYEILFNEIGFQWNKNSWRNLDIAIFNKSLILNEGIDNSYTKIPPIVVFEIDTKADISFYPDMEFYIRDKISDLLNNGVSKIFWITTFDKKILIAEKNQNWIITDWNYNINIIDNLFFNLFIELKNENILIE